MKKNILIIGNTEGLPGVKVDIENYKSFFRGSYGGSWRENEMIVKINSAKQDVMDTVTALRRSSLDYLIVIFSGHGGQRRETLMELNSEGETITESNLRGLCGKQLNIYDCCRCYPQTVNERTILNLVNKSNLSDTDTSARFEARITQAALQQVSLYACSAGEYAHDTSSGGIYSKFLFQSARELDSSYKLVGSAHAAAGALTTLSYPDQHPDSDIPRLLTSDQLILSIRP